MPDKNYQPPQRPPTKLWVFETSAKVVLTSNRVSVSGHVGGGEPVDMNYQIREASNDEKKLAEAANIKNDLIDYENQIANANEAQQKLREQVGGLKTVVDELGQENDSMKQELERATALVDSLKEELAKAKKKNR